MQPDSPQKTLQPSHPLTLQPSMAYPLQSLLKIRTMREDRAAGDLTHARHVRENAAATLERKRRTRESFEETKEERRDRVYGTVIGRIVNRESLDRVREAVMRIDEEGLLLLEDERKAADVLEEKKQDESRAHVRYVAATREHTKIDQHRNIWVEADRLVQERAEDAELEEFTGKRTTEDV